MQRGARDAVVDEWIAVAVSAYPRTKLEKTRHVEALARIVTRERALQLVEQQWHGFEQRLAEKVQSPRDFLCDRGFFEPQLAAHPQQLDIVPERENERVA